MAAETTNKFFEVNFPIDIVISWVDSTPEHSRRRLSQLREMKKRPQDNNINRYESHDELKYVIRSIYEHASWIRNIFIIVDDQQQPLWLTDRPHELSIPITLVKHTVLYGEEYSSHLPTFNSQSIECHLHRIPGLSEQFIYSNDDMFFGKTCVPDDFFNKEGKPRYVFDGIIPQGPKKKGMTQHTLAWINNTSLLNIVFPLKKQTNNMRVTPQQYPSHQAVPMLKSSFVAIWDHPAIRRLLWETSQSKFRMAHNLYVVGFLVFFNIKTGIAVKGRRSTKYIEMRNSKKNRTGVEITCKKQTSSVLSQ